MTLMQGAAELADRLRPVALKLSRHLRREALNLGVSILDAQLLGNIKLNPGIGASELAEIEQISRPSISEHLRRLEAAGWLKREKGPVGDRRRVPLALTEEGLRVLANIRRLRNDWLEARLARLSDDERAAIDAAIDPLLRLVELRI